MSVVFEIFFLFQEIESQVLNIEYCRVQAPNARYIQERGYCIDR